MTEEQQATTSTGKPAEPSPEDTLSSMLAWVRHWQADVLGGLPPTMDSLREAELELIRAAEGRDG